MTDSILSIILLVAVSTPPSPEAVHKRLLLLNTPQNEAELLIITGVAKEWVLRLPVPVKEILLFGIMLPVGIPAESNLNLNANDFPVQLE